MKRNYLCLLFSAVVASTGFALAADDQVHITRVERLEDISPWGESVQKTAVHLSDSRRYVIPLLRAEPVAVITGSDGENYLMAAGTDCIQCDENISLRFYRLSGSELERTDERYGYPGALFDYMEPERELERTRVFYGRCTGGGSDTVVWISQYLGSDGIWHSSNLVAMPTSEGMELRALSVDKKELIAMASEGIECRELPGKNGFVEP